MVGLSTTPLSVLAAVNVNDQGDGTVTLSHPDGSVVSVQPDGSIQTRPAGTAGAYERCTISGSLAVYAPSGSGGAVYLFALSPSLPNA